MEITVCDEVTMRCSELAAMAFLFMGFAGGQTAIAIESGDAAVPSYESSMAAALKAYTAGEYVRSEKLFAAAASTCKRSGKNGEELAAALAGLVDSLYTQGRTKDAEPTARRALEIRQKVLSQTDPRLARSYSVLGDINRVAGKYSDAETLYRRALALTENGPQDTALGWIYQNIAACCVVEKKYQEAEDCYRKALTIREKRPADLDLAWTLYGLGGVCYSQTRYADAEAFLMRALKIREDIPGGYGPDKTAILNNLDLVRNARQQLH